MGKLKAPKPLAKQRDMRLFRALCSLLCILFLADCASVLQNKDVLAVVDGDIITKGDLQYALQIAHRREDLSSAKSLDMEEYVQKLIDEMLIVQETQRMGLEEDPVIRKKVDSYVLRESVVRLYDEEIIRKVSVTEEEIKEHYMENYKEFSLALIESESEEDAEEVLEQLGKGGEFGEIAAEYSTHSSKKNGGEIKMKFREMAPTIKEVVSALQPDEISDVVKAGRKYYVVKLMGREDAPEDGLEEARSGIESMIKKQKKDKRSDEFLEHLRKKLNPEIDREIFDSIQPDGEKEEREEWLKDERPLVKLGDNILTAGKFKIAVLPDKIESKEAIMNNWINRKAVDIEALSRNYDTKPDLGEELRRYKSHILKDTFINRVLIPKISISEDDLKEYYSTHQDDFLEPVHYKIQRITVNEKEEAEEILKSLQGGADFSWLAKKKSSDSYASKGGAVEWIPKEKLPVPVQEIVDTLNPGDLSSVLDTGHKYIIIRLQKKTERHVKPFDKVKRLIGKQVFRIKYDELYSEFISKLKEGAEITINDEAVQSYGRAFKK
jgi:parvulin-like peptidyl-prolyl isomerase